MIKQGDHIKVRFGVLEHHGIHVGGGAVIHFSGIAQGKDAATIRHGTLEKFAGAAGVGAIEVVSYAECLAPEQVIERARSQLGRCGYHVFRNNCEQFARWCKTGHFVSDQVEVAKAVGGGVGGSATATAAALGLVSAGGVVAGTNAAGIMSGLSAAGGLVGGGAAAGVGVLAGAPAAVAVAAVHRAFRDDAALPTGERAAREAARRAGTFGAVASAFGTIGAVSAAGVPGLSAVGISTGLTAMGGSMLGGVVVAVAAPAVVAAGIAYVVYRIAKGRR